MLKTIEKVVEYLKALERLQAHGEEALTIGQLRLFGVVSTKIGDYQDRGFIKRHVTSRDGCRYYVNQPVIRDFLKDIKATVAFLDKFK